MESKNDAEKTLIHISHLHPLELVATPEPRPVCHACHIQCGVQCYGCTKCRYFLHITCATSNHSSDHPSHPAHTLSLELTPSHTSGFRCDGCGVNGSTFAYRCRECDYDLHLHCAALPSIVNHQSHSHPLSLFYKIPDPNPPKGTRYYCELCKGNLDASKWFYRCNTCNFGGHVGCFAPETLEVVSPGLQASKTDLQQQLLTAHATSLMIGNTMDFSRWMWRNM